MKVGDLVRVTNNESHRLFGYGLVIDQTTINLGERTKVQWLRYKGETNPRWMITHTLEKTE
jgi:hypothetical protein